MNLFKKIGFRIKTFNLDSHEREILRAITSINDTVNEEESGNTTAYKIETEKLKLTTWSEKFEALSEIDEPATFHYHYHLSIHKNIDVLPIKNEHYHPSITMSTLTYNAMYKKHKEQNGNKR